MPSNIRSQGHVEYDKSKIPPNDETNVAQLTSRFPEVTSHQMKQLFHSWVKHSKKSLSAPPIVSMSFF